MHRLHADLSATRPRRGPLATSGLLALTLALGGSACSDDEVDAAATTTEAETASSEDAPEETTTTSAPSDDGDFDDADIAAFCEAELAAESAAIREDGEAIGPAFAAFVDAAPPELTDAAQAVVDNADAGPESEEFDEGYAAVIGYMQQSCGYTEVTVSARDYAYDGIPATLPAGPAIFEMANEGAEPHLLYVTRVTDGITAPAVELAALDEAAAAEQLVTFAQAFAPPTQTSFGTTTLEPGRYVVFCPIPQGAGEELLEGGEPTGPPHSALGMLAEFTVD